MASGDTKTEAMLNVLGNGGSGDEFRACCNTKTQAYILDAIDRINNLDPGGGGSGDIKKLTAADATFHGTDGNDYIPVWELETGIYTYNPNDMKVPGTEEQFYYLLFDKTEDFEVGGYLHINNDGQEGILIVTNDGAPYSVVWTYLNPRHLQFGEVELPSADCISFSIAPKELAYTLGDSYTAAIAQGAVTQQLEWRAMNDLTPEWYDRFDQEDPDNPVIPLWQLNTGIYKLTEYTRLQLNTTDAVLEPSETKLILVHNYSPGSSDVQAIVYDENMGSSASSSSPAYGGQVIITAYDGTKVKNTKILTEESGGGGTTVVQTTGTSQTDVMSQDAVSKMIFANPGTDTNIKIGKSASALQSNGLVVIGERASARSNSVAIGSRADAGAYNSICIGNNSSINASSSVVIGSSSSTIDGNAEYNVLIGYNTYGSSGKYSVGLGAYAKPTRTGEVNIGTNNQMKGYNSTDYRVIGGVHDGQDAHDAVTVNQVNATIDAINTALSTNIPHIGSQS